MLYWFMMLLSSYQFKKNQKNKENERNWTKFKTEIENIIVVPDNTICHSTLKYKEGKC
jgi:hypothetical protein